MLPFLTRIDIHRDGDRMTCTTFAQPRPAAVFGGKALSRIACGQLGGIDIHRSQIMAAARWTKPVK
ncbi:hypothetical protein, partial [Sphingomonas sp. CFBP 13720]|uniref:hypothetical protein n=1 Tax=Sphingomonas sp. CFBP 13720 TaxID=2775302 RepID=UPI001A7EE6F6